MKAEIKLWSTPLANGKHKLYVDVSFGAHSISGNRKKINTHIAIDRK